MTYPIFHQGYEQGECAGFSILGALIRMKPDTDYQRISKEILAEDGNSMGIMRAANWFKKKGYIKDIRRVKYVPFLIKKQPIITSLYSVDWSETGKAPFKLTYKPKGTGGTHLVCIDSLGKIANSYGENFGDKGYFYFTPDQAKTFGQCFILEL